ncbi:hypothetical protein [Aquabacterium humicola]|uniref:hypothetical protein n=1 Tax=Aquabacterium humicola TaxID=3237377 RepID=UPI0025437D11|nr:hypothetical protein [Rubrivivax pictus]
MSRAAALIVCFAFAAAACGEAKHEPVKVIATARDRAPSPEPPPTATPPTVQPESAPPIATAASVPARPTRSAAASVPVLPGFNDRPPRFIQPGEPTGNDAFRRAFADRAASRPR